ncbi:hypothetical protein Glove_63g93 [Diversispora epigaea]|uniref:Methyltransferase type 11 domain-containing protein n=1 Tax=Diversispora epigaea TaxID=1348612 RepID=A0A397JDM7_9GLOM|nr:hypothetical protein Glove_63g93 [Diversispora epigaea]
MILIDLASKNFANFYSFDVYLMQIIDKFFQKKKCLVQNIKHHQNYIIMTRKQTNIHPILEYKVFKLTSKPIFLITCRTIELLNLPENEPAFLLDIGCGSGLSGEILDEEGHFWVGIDIAPSMLQIALEREVEGDLFLQDAGHGLGFRPGTFDGAISISVLQWLSRAIFQFYPENDDQCELIMNVAMKCGFQGWFEIALEREVEGDLFLQDAGHGLGFRPGTFDGAISISVLQWLCNADRKSNNSVTRIDSLPHYIHP